MAKYIFTFFIIFSLTTSFSQSTKDIPKTLIGKWTIQKIDVTIDNKKTTDAIEDTSYYVFSSDNTYTLTCTDLWGKAKIVGKWKPEGKKVKLFDITHISDIKGPLPTNGVGYYVEFKNINKQLLLFISSYDKELAWLHELYYKKYKP